ncbi:MAG TPA: hypothetical protein PLB12_05680 [Candidatus Goldiibacteriota bacterium]|nr:hypothetical protein [Candidatus Goldiibacteriota bacterium]HRQ43825.1 hypothetical protein [Candidatus Goldiibacteriota bacterium]
MKFKKLLLILFCAFIPAGIFSYSYSTTVEWINMTCTGTEYSASCTLTCRFCGARIITVTSYSTSINPNDYMHCCPGMAAAYFPGCTCAGNMPDCSHGSSAGGSVNVQADTYGAGFFTPNSQDGTKAWLMSAEKKWEVLKRVALDYGFNNPQDYIMSYGGQMGSRDYWTAKMLAAYNEFDGEGAGKTAVKPAAAKPRVNPCNDPNVVCLDEGQTTVYPEDLKKYDPAAPFEERAGKSLPSVIDEKRSLKFDDENYRQAETQAAGLSGGSEKSSGLAGFLASDMYSKIEGKVTDAGMDATMDALSGGNEKIKGAMGTAVELYGIYDNVKNLDTAAKQGNEALGAEMNNQFVGYLSGKMEGIQGEISKLSIKVIQNYTTNLTENVMQGLKKAGDIATNPNSTMSDVRELLKNDYNGQ